MTVPELAERFAPVPAGSQPAQRMRARSVGAPILLLALTVFGAVIRLVVAHQSLFGDELSTYWIVATHGLRGVLSLLYGTSPIKHAEISPPLSFLASWVGVQVDHTPELLRAPALVAGIASIPLVFALGDRTLGRRAAWLAAALTTLSPFMVYYSTEARAYGLMMALTMASTFAMLQAIDTGRGRWWVLYAICACAAFYSHYTCAFVLLAQLGWLIWAHRELARAAVVASLGAALGVLPWLPGLYNDFTSPTLKILSALSPFTAHDVVIALEHWAVGYPYANSVALTALPGVLALVMLGVALVLAAGAIARRGGRLDGLDVREDHRLALIVVLALSTALGEVLASALSSHIFGVRNLAASWPYLGLVFSALLIAAGPRVRWSAAALAVLAFGIAASDLFKAANRRPDYAAAAAVVDRGSPRVAAVIDETGEISPGPLTPLGVILTRTLPVVRAGAPAERDHPFGFSDPLQGIQQASVRALAAAHGGPIAVVTTLSPPGDIAALQQRAEARDAQLPASYRLVVVHTYPGIARVQVKVYARSQG
jgi:hypothetical protein